MNQPNKDNFKRLTLDQIRKAKEERANERLIESTLKANEADLLARCESISEWAINDGGFDEDEFEIQMDSQIVEGKLVVGFMLVADAGTIEYDLSKEV